MLVHRCARLAWQALHGSPRGQVARYRSPCHDRYGSQAWIASLQWRSMLDAWVGGTVIRHSAMDELSATRPAVVGERTKVFISYSRKGSAFAGKLLAALNSRGFKSIPRYKGHLTGRAWAGAPRRADLQRRHSSLYNQPRRHRFESLRLGGRGEPARRQAHSSRRVATDGTRGTPRACNGSTTSIRDSSC